MAQSLSRSTQEPVRQDLIDWARGLIDRGDYITSERVDGAVEKLLGEIDLTA